MKTISNAGLRAAVESLTNRQCFNCCSNWGSLLSIDCGEKRECVASFSTGTEKQRARFEGDIVFWITSATWRIFHGNNVFLDSDSTNMQETRRIEGESLISIEFDSDDGGMAIHLTNEYSLHLYVWPGEENFGIKVFGTWYSPLKLGELFVLAESP